MQGLDNDNHYRKLLQNIDNGCPYTQEQMELLRKTLAGYEVIRLDYMGDSVYTVGLSREAEPMEYIELTYDQLQELATSYFHKVFRKEGLLYYKNEPCRERAQQMVDKWQ